MARKAKQIKRLQGIRAMFKAVRDAKMKRLKRAQATAQKNGWTMPNPELI